MASDALGDDTERSGEAVQRPDGYIEQCYGYAKRLAQAIHAKHYSEVAQWRALPDLLGILTQIDNMTCGLTREAVRAEPSTNDSDPKQQQGAE